MQYISSRGSEKKVFAAEAIVQGLAEDGGLFVPQRFPQWSLEQIAGLKELPYHALSACILSTYLTDFSETEVQEMTLKAYGHQFTAPEVLPITQLDDQESVLELFHGPTLAFKDVALQILPHLMKASMEKTGEKKTMLILVATSGDTGKAALEGFKDVPGTAIAVFYPQDGVSETQKLQMLTQEGENVYVCGVEGNFDDAQTGVKRIFSDVQMQEKLAQKGYRLSSANSINWGRLLPQIAYYFWSYVQLLKSEEIRLGDPVNFVVPTGNFGNILAGYYAKRMGLPIGKLLCASNRNNVLTDFFEQGSYDRNREFFKTSSPSMDILISSNLERLLFELSDRDGLQVAKWMQALKEQGKYEILDEQKENIQKDFYAAWCDDELAAQTIKRIFECNDYLMDPHTAVAQCVYDAYYEKTDDKIASIVLSTANPYKFAKDVLEALNGKAIAEEDGFKLCEMLSAYSKTKIPEAVLALKDKPVLHRDVYAPTNMEAALIKQVDNWKK